ncbi:bifunctional UDP-sugar hydrolase/5'-nucleotidase [Nocardioides bigeumensis]|uniref:Bifunctional metallophosphatase/5'-nucleotidase n=1 Tax=Nocardioides bigeumensis TaxID=433657 RepID=A0ABN2XMT4_9ACTN
MRTHSTSVRRCARLLLTSGVGLALAATTLSLAAASVANAAPVQIQILATNDFHGRLLPGSNGQAGAAKLAGVVKQLETDFAGETFFAAAGDLIGASTFDSFIQKDKPTIDALNAADLDVSAVGNHELDQGYADLVNRVMAPYDATTNPLGGAQWKYLAANLRKRADNSPAVDASWVQTVNGVQIGFVGAVTEELPSLVSPAGIADITVTNIVTEVNAAAADLTTNQGADLVVLLVHEGATTTAASSATDPASAFGRIVNGVSTNIDAIVSGHTHLAYNHSILQNGRQLPVVSAGQYGTNLNKLVFNVENGLAPSVVSQTVVPVATTAVTAPGAVTLQSSVQTNIIDPAIAKADVLGAVPLGRIGAALGRARLSAVVGDSDENRGGESTLGNLVAEVQRWATSAPISGEAQIAFMNPGGLREDLSAATYPAVVTYRQAADVQSFANTLVNMRLTGAQIKTVLEQQWQRDADGNVPSRPFLRLGTSKGFQYTYDPTRKEGDRVTGIWLNGTALSPTTAYSVTVNSFLASGGDNFREFANGTQRRDTGKVDLQAMVDYFAELASVSGDPPLPVDYSQHSIGVSRPTGAPKFYRIGQRLDLRLTSWRMTAKTDKTDSQVAAKIGSVSLVRPKVDNTVGTDPFDEYGKALLNSRLGLRVPIGEQTLILRGPGTGTVLRLPVEIRKAKPTVKGKVFRKSKIRVDRTRPKIRVKLKVEGIDKIQGKVRIKTGGRTYLGQLNDNKVTLTLARYGERGMKKIQVTYLGTKAIASARETLRVKVRR